MKFSVTFKDPDGPADCVDEAVRKEIAAMGLTGDEADAVFELRREKVSTQIAKWFDYGEYVTIDIDTDADTATVRKGG